MSWLAIAGLAAGAYAFKVLGLVVLGPRAASGLALRAAALLPAALLPALVVVGTLGGDRVVEIDARSAGLAVSIVAVSRRAPFWLTITLAATATALVRMLGG